MTTAVEADQAHLSLENVHELRQFVDAQSSNPPADPRNPGIVAHLEQWAGSSLR